MPSFKAIFNQEYDKLLDDGIPPEIAEKHAYERAKDIYSEAGDRLYDEWKDRQMEERDTEKGT
jgi:hypothetical protein